MFCGHFETLRTLIRSSDLIFWLVKMGPCCTVDSLTTWLDLPICSRSPVSQPFLARELVACWAQAFLEIIIINKMGSNINKCNCFVFFCQIVYQNVKHGGKMIKENYGGKIWRHCRPFYRLYKLRSSDSPRVIQQSSGRMENGTRFLILEYF